MPDFKLFTLQEAEQTLPLVRRIVQDLTAEYPGWRAAVSRSAMRRVLTKMSVVRCSAIRSASRRCSSSHTSPGITASRGDEGSSMRRSTTPTVPSRTDMPKKCSVSQNGHTQSWAAT